MIYNIRLQPTDRQHPPVTLLYSFLPSKQRVYSDLVASGKVHISKLKLIRDKLMQVGLPTEQFIKISPRGTHLYIGKDMIIHIEFLNLATV